MVARNSKSIFIHIINITVFHIKSIVNHFVMKLVNYQNNQVAKVKIALECWVQK